MHARSTSQSNGKSNINNVNAHRGLITRMHVVGANLFFSSGPMLGAHNTSSSLDLEGPIPGAFNVVVMVVVMVVVVVEPTIDIKNSRQRTLLFIPFPRSPPP